MEPERRNQPQRSDKWVSRQLRSFAICVVIVAGIGWLTISHPQTAQKLQKTCQNLIHSRLLLEDSFSALGEQLCLDSVPEAVEAWCVTVFAPEAALEDDSDSSRLAPEEPPLDR